MDSFGHFGGGGGWSKSLGAGNKEMGGQSSHMMLMPWSRPVHNWSNPAFTLGYFDAKKVGGDTCGCAFSFGPAGKAKQLPESGQSLDPETTQRRERHPIVILGRQPIFAEESLSVQVYTGSVLFVQKGQKVDPASTCACRTSC